MEESTYQRFGRVVLTQHELRLRRWLGVFGQGFAIPWQELEGWSCILLTWDEDGSYAYLQLHRADDLHIIQEPSAGGRFADLVAEIRRRVPDKEFAVEPGREKD